MVSLLPGATGYAAAMGAKGLEGLAAMTRVGNPEASRWGVGEPAAVLAELAGGTLVVGSFFTIPAFYSDFGHNISVYQYLGLVDELIEATDNPLWLSLYAWWVIPIAGAFAMLHAVLAADGIVSPRSAGRVSLQTGGVALGALLIGCVGEALSTWKDFDAELDIVLRTVLRPVVGLWDGAPTFSLLALGASTMLLGGLVAARMAGVAQARTHTELTPRP